MGHKRAAVNRNVTRKVRSHCTDQLPEATKRSSAAQSGDRSKQGQAGKQIGRHNGAGSKPSGDAQAMFNVQ